MAEIRNYPFWHHLRVDASSFALHFRGNRLLHSGRGLSFWFRPLKDSVAEVPADDRELPLLVHTRSQDFQEITVQGLVTYRVIDPVKLSQRVDFTVDPKRGVFLRQPLEKLAQIFAQLAQQHAADFMAHRSVRQMLLEGYGPIRERVEEGLLSDPTLQAMGLAVTGVRVISLKPGPDVEKALEAPMREKIKQEADEASFSRRALAVEKERAIQENELQNRIELAKREEQLITQQGQNECRLAEERAEAEFVALNADLRAKALRSEAENQQLRAQRAAEAEGIRLVEGAKLEAEQKLLEAQAQLPPAIMMGLALKAVAGKLQRIDHLNVGADMLGSALVNFLESGSRPGQISKGGKPVSDEEPRL